MKKPYLFLILIFFVANIGIAQDSFNGCPMVGAVNPRYSRQVIAKKQALNRLKNRHNIPTNSNFDTQVSLASMLLPGEDAERFSDEFAVTIEGYVSGVNPEKAEDCNCGATEEPYTDIHINLVPTTRVSPKNTIVVEITPRLREKIFTQLGLSEFKSSKLKKLILGKKIRVAGWLMYDWMHKGMSYNNGARGRSCKRASCWEVHPITAMKVLD